MDIKKKELEVKRDIRGSLYEVLRPEDVGEGKFGQILITTAKPGQKKGGHYHLRKREWYCVISGDAKIEFENPKTHEKIEIRVTAEKPCVVEMPKGILHSIENIGSGEMTLLVYINESYRSNDPDTFRS